MQGPLQRMKLWKSGVIGTKTPKALQNAVFFIIVKIFSLCGGVELREIKPSQVRRHTDPDRYVYTENVLKSSFQFSSQISR